ncbi:hypothetical protein Hypma_001565 [Hypsizygus marmoreus]|uniref:Uncharacterized protein n=1 Tax=Hypsizygus marmoreus TaxID=39966 RepID=A0A369K3M3_HYPMA|nr:hypothetical protein Hypma_001565 [Hypsizygus marmoreus]
MPRRSERQQAADALHQAYIVSVMAEAKADLVDLDIEMTSDSDSSSSSSSSSESMAEDLEPGSQSYLDLLGNLYSAWYLIEWGSINKTSENMRLLLHD